MKTYNTIIEAQAAAELELNSSVGIESANGNIIEFYSKNDPGSEDTFTCIVEDGRNRSCVNGGQVIVTEK